MLKKILAEKEYLPILQLADGTPVTAENWRERRAEMLRLLEKYSYGVTPPAPESVTGTVVEEKPYEYARKVCVQNVTISFTTERGEFSFPITMYIPRKVTTPPVLLHLAFNPVPDDFIPVEEITDGGYALVVLAYENVVNDAHFGDFSDGLAAYFGTTMERGPEEWGKIGMWAYAASRVLDYIIADRKDLDGSKVAVMGHSRLGKTALWAGAQDERFFCTISNDSGYGGAASSKHGTGERVHHFIDAGSWDWFCENFKDYTGEKEDQKPYDQSFMIACVAPRYLYVGSAVEDGGADPMSEFLTTLHAAKAWEVLGKDGLLTEDRMPVGGDSYQEGCVGYHLREGGHFLSREDWGQYMRFLDKKIGR